MQITNFSITTKKGKPIVRNLNFYASNGQLLAIMGPSGSGKTTVLDLLSGNINSSLVYKGNFVTKGFTKYVSQDDNLHGFYTVRQYLKHYISLSYGNISKENRRKIITRTAECTGLTSALDTKVGDIFFKGLSGGQKRRLSIALELVKKPDILILDEPTSGLDSVSAYYIIEVLKNLTKEGICVVCTLHQPSSQIWSQIDQVLLLSNGYPCYFGGTEGAQFFFESIGKIIPKTNFNPSDFYLFQINADFDRSIDPAKINAAFIAWRDNAAPQDIVKKPEVKGEQQIIVESISDMTNLVVKVNLDEALSKVKKSKANLIQKCAFLCQRNLFNSFKNPGILGIRLVMYIMLTFMIGFLYFDLGSSFNHQDIISRTSLLFYVDAFLVFMSIAVLPFFMIERAIVLKEVNNSLYRPIHYQVGRFIAALPGIALIAIVSSLLVNLIANLNGFGVFFVILFLSLVVAESLAMLVSLIVPHYIIGMALIAGLYGMFMLVEGFLIVKEDIPGYFIWVHYMAFHTYSFEAFMYNEFNSIASFSSTQFPSGQKVLEFYSMDDTEIWKDVVILIGYFLLLEVFITMVMSFIFRKKTIKSVHSRSRNQASNQSKAQMELAAPTQPSRQNPEQIVS